MTELKVGDLAWWTGAAPAPARKVRIREDLGGRWVYRTVGGAVGWEADDVKEHFRHITDLGRNR